MMTFDVLKYKILKDEYFDINDIEFDTNTFESGIEFIKDESNIYQNGFSGLYDRNLKKDDHQ